MHYSTSAEVAYIDKFINILYKGIVIIEITVVVKRIFEAIFCLTSYASAINIVEIAVGVPACSIKADD